MRSAGIAEQARVLTRASSVNFLQDFLEAQQRRNAVPMRRWAELAWWYQTAVQEGDRNPAQTLVNSHPSTKLKTWQNAFSRCRNLGLLTDPPRRGVAGGSATELALELMGLSDDTPRPELAEEYRATRRQSTLADLGGIIEQPGKPVRTQPSRSQFDSDAQFNEAFEEWAEAGSYLKPIAADVRPWARQHLDQGSTTFQERYDDWFDRKAAEEAEDEAWDELWNQDIDPDSNDAWLHQAIEQATTRDELRWLWARNRGVFDASPELLEAWKAKGTELV